MGWYILKLAIMLPLIGLLIWGSLKLARRMQSQITKQSGSGKRARLVETTMLSPGLKLAVVEFHDREILLAVSRNGVTQLAEVQSEDTRFEDALLDASSAAAPHRENAP